MNEISLRWGNFASGGDEINLERAINHDRASVGKLDSFQTRRSQCFRLKVMTYCAAPACLKSSIYDTETYLSSI